MGERDRSQSYDNRNEGEHRDEHRDQGQRAQRDWSEEVRRSQGREHNDHNDRNYGQSYGQSSGQDRNYGQGSNQNYGQSSGQQYGQTYGQNYGQSYGQDRNHNQSFGQGQDRNYGYGSSQRHQDDQGFGQRYNAGGFDAGRYPSYGAYDHRYDRQQNDWDQGRRSEYEGSYARDERERALQGRGGFRSYGGGAGRGFQQEQNIGGWYGQDLHRGAQGNLQRDWNARGESESRGTLRGYGYGYNEGRNQQNDHDGDSFGQQLRDGASRVARQVKRAFRGPKGYKRSDERIREDVSDRLAEQNQLDPSDIEVAVSNGDVTLTGQVNSRHEKWLAEEIADDISGVNDVQNQLRVRREQQSHTAGTHASDTTASSIANQSTTEAQRRNARS